MSNWQQLALNEINNKTKPAGSLGRLEELAIQTATIQQSLRPQIYPAQVLIFAGDHGVAIQGVSAYPAEVTAQMMANFSAGGAAINIISKAVKASIKVVDVGVNADLSMYDNLAMEKINYGTADMSTSAAMTDNECCQAIEIGGKYANMASKDGIKTLALGEMGIANTTSAAALTCAITQHSPEDIVGRGTGIADDVLMHKRLIVQRSLDIHQSAKNNPRQLLTSLGGFEIAAMIGAILKAQRLGLVIIIDGFISTAAALCAYQINPHIKTNLIFSHQSAEHGHRLALEFLGAKPLLNLNLRLGEATGAALSIPIIDSAAKILADMATFEQAGVSTKHTDV